MISTTRIREVVLSDLNDLVLLEQENFDEESFSRRQIRYLITKAKSDCLVAETDGKISAYAILLKRKRTFGLRLYSIAVSSEFRGRGVAGLLLEEAERRAVEYGFIYVTLEVNEKNDAAINLYLKAGFETFGERLNYYKDGSKALLMKKKVGRDTDL